MKIKQTEFVIIDTETTGLSATNGDRMVEIAAVKIRNGEISERFESLINPERSVPEGAQNIHKITKEMLKNAPKAEKILPDVLHFIGGACVVGHNIKFDLDFLCYQLSLIRRKLKNETPAIDTLKMAKYFLPHLSNYSLSSVALSFGIKIKENHRALADAELTAQIFIRFLDMAEEQKMGTFQKLFEKFNIPKPNFKINLQGQEILF
ncbi:MAG TPA: 3'-5' exonuclease [Candidatus Omnitrophota bacterium]|nr:3'-5' exonuclease [Candidatus Omnitrophota bacterium]HPN88625.1 3'-5' exonuclease [Candidatus Omnitrophota bacterium]